MKTAFLFPGQGSQIVGMGKELYNNFKIAKMTFEEVDDSLSTHLSKIIFEGPEAELGMTENTQPAIMATSIAYYRVHKEENGELPTYFAGHSLGEYSALVAAESMTLSDATKLLNIRGKAMQSACKEYNSGMAAILGLQINEVKQIIEDLIDSNKYVCEIANHNSKEQIVISGHEEAVDIVINHCKTLPKKAVKLKVSAPFHSSLIKEAEYIMRDYLQDVKISEPIKPVIANVTADLFGDENHIKELLAQQTTAMVKWYDIMNFIISHDINNIKEFGHGNVLTNLFKRHL